MQQVEDDANFVQVGVAIGDLTPGGNGVHADDAQLVRRVGVLLGIGGEFGDDEFGVGDGIVVQAALLEHFAEDGAGSAGGRAWLENLDHHPDVTRLLSSGVPHTRVIGDGAWRKIAGWPHGAAPFAVGDGAQQETARRREG